MKFNEEASLYGLAAVGGLVVLKKLFSVVQKVVFLLRCYVFSSITDFKKFGKWIVITGATDGIGKNIAIQLAKHGYPLILLSKDQEKLQIFSNELRNQYKVEVKHLVIDFNTSDPAIYNEIEKFLEGLDIGTLFNNVGILPQLDRFSELKDSLKCHEAVNVNILPMFRMTHIILPEMKKRRRGMIVNISSASQLRPAPCMAIYGSTKCLNHYFSNVLAIENEEYGIKVQSIRPFLVKTNLTLNNKWGFFTEEADSFAKSLLGTIGKARTAHGSLKHEILSLFMSLPSDKQILRSSLKTSQRFKDFALKQEKMK